MSKLSITWNKFTVHKKHDADQDTPYVWVFGIVVDVDTLRSGEYVIRRPAGHENLGKRFRKGEHVAVPRTLDIVRDVTPILGTAVAGVVVVAWENAMTRDKVTEDAYDAAADAINAFVARRIDAGNLEAPSDTEVEALGAAIRDDIRTTIREGWTVFQLIPDHVIGQANCVVALTDTVTHALDLRFTKPSTDYQLQGELEFTA